MTESSHVSKLLVLDESELEFVVGGACTGGAENYGESDAFCDDTVSD